MKAKAMKLSNYTKEELAVVDADSAYWQEFADLVGWRLAAFTGRRNALFHQGRLTASIEGWQRDDIMTAVAREMARTLAVAAR